MATATNLLIKQDTGATELTFEPIQQGGSETIWRQSGTGSLLSLAKLSTGVRRSKTGITTATVQIEIPVMETATAQNAEGYTAAPRIAYTVTAKIQLHSHDRATAAQRADALKLLLGACSGSSATTATGTVNQASAAAALIGTRTAICDLLVRAAPVV